MVYIKEYTELSPQEKRQLSFKRRFKLNHPEWDDSMILLTKLVKECVPRGARVLDAGCGHGNFVLDELQGTFGEIIGIDTGHDTTFKNDSVDHVVEGSLETLPFPDQSFDAVISLWVLEHITDPKKVFAEIFRILKPGGVFAFVTPHALSLLVMARRLLSHTTAQKITGKLYGRDYHDIFPVVYRTNSVSQIKKLARANKFTVEFLKTNFDPSYTSFGESTYRLSEVMRFLPFSLGKVHVVGILRKE
jgi:ubiquinone/menaquinone biosynthesis C-methylase UbiE